MTTDTHQLISRYEGGSRYLELTKGPFGYGYQGPACGGGFGTNTSKEAALAEFGQLVAADPVKLLHVKGERAPNPLDGCTIGQPMTTAEMKRRIKVGDRWTLQHRDGEPSARTIAHVQSKDFASLRDGHVPKRSNWSWMAFVKSDRLRDLGNGAFVVLDGRTGEPLLTYTPAPSCAA